MNEATSRRQTSVFLRPVNGIGQNAVARRLLYNRRMGLKRRPKVIAFPRRARHSRHSRWHAAVARLESRMDALERRLSGGRRQIPLGTRMRTAIIASLVLHVLAIYGI